MSLFGLGAAPPLTRADKALVLKTAKALANLVGGISSFVVKVPRFLRDDPERAEYMQEGAAENVKREAKHLYHVLRSTPPRHRLKVAAAISVVWPYSAFIDLPTVEAIFTYRERERFDQVSAGFPYPCAPMDRRAKVVLGESPEAQSYVLTKKQAHLWFSCPEGRYPDNASEWYLVEVLGMPPGSYSHQSIFDERRGLEWFTGVWNDPVRKEAMFRERVVLGPEGEELRGSFWSRLDELETEDLTKSVERTFRNAVDRLVAEQQAGYEEDDLLIPVPSWWIGSKYVELLVTPRQLSKEGREMSHCAGMYVSRVAGKYSLVISIKTNTCRSTVELDPQTLRVRQHVGFGNKEPHPDCEKVLEVHLHRWMEKALG